MKGYSAGGNAPLPIKGLGSNEMMTTERRLNTLTPSAHHHSSGMVATSLRDQDCGPPDTIVRQVR
jgi:hypothetical protein